MPKILIVEDDPILLKTLREFLSAEKFEVLCAADGEEGVRAAKSEKPDLILLDIILPKKDGYEVIKEIKSDPQVQNVPIILLTNLGGIHDVEKALKLGATTYLIKSDYKLEEVVKKVKETLENKSKKQK